MCKGCQMFEAIGYKKITEHQGINGCLRTRLELKPTTLEYTPKYGLRQSNSEIVKK